MPLSFINFNENVAFKVFGTIGNQYVQRFANYGIPANNYWTGRSASPPPSGAST